MLKDWFWSCYLSLFRLLNLCGLVLKWIPWIPHKCHLNITLDTPTTFICFWNLPYIVLLYSSSSNLCYNHSLHLIRCPQEYCVHFPITGCRRGVREFGWICRKFDHTRQVEVVEKGSGSYRASRESVIELFKRMWAKYVTNKLTNDHWSLKLTTWFN